MSRTPARFTQADVTRALRALEQSGFPGAVEILPDGTIRIVPLDALNLKPKEDEDSWRYRDIDL